MTRDEIIKQICKLIPNQRQSGVCMTPLELLHQIVDVMERNKLPEQDEAVLLGVCVSLMRLEFSEMDAGITSIEAINKAQRR